MKTAVLALGLLASLAVAQPHHGHHHRRKAHNHGRHHEKRGIVTEWVTETVVEYVTEIVDEHTTETILPNKSKFSPPQAAAVTTTTGRPGQFFEGASSAPKPAAETAAPAAPYVSESPSAPPAPDVVVTDEESPAPAPPAPAPPAPAPAPPAPAPNVQVSNPAPAPAPAAAQAPAGARTGELTFYQVGLGACGFDDSGKDHAENIVALSHLLMGEQSNGNPYCGRRITVSYNGETRDAVVRDKCMGCAIDNIDGSEKLFTSFQPLGTGRFKVDWWFSD
ncbi:hypothetical protein OQA88_11370 [Cercophora sp. LCS_1]